MGNEKQEIVAPFGVLVPTWEASWAGRVFGITERGLMGLFLAGTQKGDLISVFHGVKVPFSMMAEIDGEGQGRETGYFTLVGPAYVHGIMDGSVFDQGCEASRMFKLK